MVREIIIEMKSSNQLSAFCVLLVPKKLTSCELQPFEISLTNGLIGGIGRHCFCQPSKRARSNILIYAFFLNPQDLYLRKYIYLSHHECKIQNCRKTYQILLQSRNVCDHLLLYSVLRGRHMYATLVFY